VEFLFLYRALKRGVPAILIALGCGLLGGVLVGTLRTAVYNVKALIRPANIAVSSHQSYPGSGKLSEQFLREMVGIGQVRNNSPRSVQTLNLIAEIEFKYGKESQKSSLALSNSNAAWIEEAGFASMSDLIEITVAAHTIEAATKLVHEIVKNLQADFEPKLSQFQKLTNERIRERESQIKQLNKNLSLLGNAPGLFEAKEKVNLALLEYRSVLQELKMSLGPGTTYNHTLISLRPISNRPVNTPPWKIGLALSVLLIGVIMSILLISESISIQEQLWKNTHPLKRTPNKSHLDIQRKVS
jgi:hypothetical protein